MCILKYRKKGDQMDQLELRKIVENYKKMQLYALDDIPIEDAIIDEIGQEIVLYTDYALAHEEQLQILAKVIAYLEFGLPYESHKMLFEKVLELCQIAQKTLKSLVNWDAQYIRPSQLNLQKVLIWKTGRSNHCLKKGEVVADLLHNIREHRLGIYIYQSEFCCYQLVISEEDIVLKNLRKGIQYYLD